ncbi:hypothetical protein [uncultured Dokdonia sp.]|uniref:hypothetical protein n=1 Tax=uncultured Dokdonia sp. TaxID=575653 RepID=UPI002637AC35|nr:hypothetical protein [uncultured Dokdonia sp.]
MKDYIQQIFDYKHKLTKQKLQKLTKADIKMLFNALRSRDPKINFKKNIQILSTIVPDMVREELYKIVLDPKETTYIRTLSASCLNTIYDDKAELVYLKLLKIKDQPNDLKNKLIKGLGKFGTKKSLPLLTKLREESPMDRMLVLSTLLITSKYQLPNRLKIDFEAIPQTKQGKRQKIKYEHQKSGVKTQSEVYGMKYSKECICYECASEEHTLLINEEVSSRKRSYSKLLGVLQAKFIGDTTFYTKLLLFLDATNIYDKRILGFRTDGLLAYAGKLNKDGSFSVNSVKKFGSDQVKITGQIINNKVVLNEFYSSNTLTPRKRPVRVL